MFCHPPGSAGSDIISAQPIRFVEDSLALILIYIKNRFRFYFTDQTRVSSTIAGENCVVQMVGSLFDAIERDYGSLATRMYRAFRPKPGKSTKYF